MAKKKEGKEKKLDRKTFDKELKKLQTELVKLQEWVKHEGLKVVVVFEGRDAAGKGGVIKRIMERVSPRVFRVVALPAPSDREKTQFYYQRYLTQLPAAGEAYNHESEFILSAIIILYNSIPIILKLNMINNPLIFNSKLHISLKNCNYLLNF